MQETTREVARQIPCGFWYVAEVLSVSTDAIKAHFSPLPQTKVYKGFSYSKALRKGRDKMRCDTCGHEMQEVEIDSGLGYMDIAFECHTKWCKRFIGKDIYKSANELVDFIIKNSFSAQAEAEKRKEKRYRK